MPSINASQGQKLVAPFGSYLKPNTVKNSCQNLNQRMTLGSPCQAHGLCTVLRNQQHHFTYWSQICSWHCGLA